MPFTFVAAVSATNATGGVDTTTGTINTTTAAGGLLVAWINYDDAAVAGVTDSAGNSWTPLTEVTANATSWGRLYYVLNPSTSATHSFTGDYVSGTGSPAIWAAAFAVSGGTPAYNSQESGASGASPGSITPSVNNCLLVAGCSNSSGAATAVNSSFTLSQAKAEAANTWAVAGAYQIQTTATARNPTFSGGGGTYFCTAQAVFRIDASGGGSRQGRLQRMGVGRMHHRTIPAPIPGWAPTRRVFVHYQRTPAGLWLPRAA